MYYRVCSICGASLDPGERCDCLEIRKKQLENIQRFIKPGKNGQFVMNFQEQEEEYEKAVGC